MKVIFQKQYKKHDIGAIVDLKFGFVKNFLLPRKIVAIATKEAIDSIKNKSEEIKLASNKMKSKAAEVKSFLSSGYSVKIEIEANSDGTLYSSIKPSDLIKIINTDLKAKNFEYELDFSDILIKEKIKSCGTHQIEINLLTEKVSIQLNVVQLA
jgi:large subunit ribosomal protein L9